MLNRDNGHALMPGVRAVAVRLAPDGCIRISQRGRAVDAQRRGAVRLRLR